MTSVEPVAQHARRLADRAARHRHVDRVVAEVRQAQVLEQQPAVGVRVGAHPQRRPSGASARMSSCSAAVLVEQLVRRGTTRASSSQHVEVLGGVAGAGERHLVRAPRARSVFLPSMYVGPGPALGGAEHDHRPARALLVAGVARCALISAISSSTSSSSVANRRWMSSWRLVVEARDEEVRLVAVARP